MSDKKYMVKTFLTKEEHEGLSKNAENKYQTKKAMGRYLRDLVRKDQGK